MAEWGNILDLIGVTSMCSVQDVSKIKIVNIELISNI